MKAAVFETYGGPEVFDIRDIPKPEPKDKEVLVKVSACSLNYGDLVARNFKALNSSTFNMPLPLLLPAKLFFGFSRPRINILGNEFSGTVEAVGSEVTAFTPGDEVFGYSGQSMGANAEYITIKADGMIAKKPAAISFSEAAVLPYGGITAGDLLANVIIKTGDRILINGASGGIGSAALQIAKRRGAEVTGVCGTGRIDFVRELGADNVIDYKTEDFTSNGQKYDLIMDVYGRLSFSRCKESLTEDGLLLLASFKTGRLFQMLWTSLFSRQKVKCAMAGEKQASIERTRQWIEDGTLKAVVDKEFPLSDISEAHRYMESGSNKAKVVIIIPET